MFNRFPAFDCFRIWLLRLRQTLLPGIMEEGEEKLRNHAHVFCIHFDFVPSYAGLEQPLSKCHKRKLAARVLHRHNEKKHGSGTLAARMLRWRRAAEGTPQPQGKRGRVDASARALRRRRSVEGLSQPAEKDCKGS